MTFPLPCSSSDESLSTSANTLESRASDTADPSPAFPQLWVQHAAGTFLVNDHCLSYTLSCNMPSAKYVSLAGLTASVVIKDEMHKQVDTSTTSSSTTIIPINCIAKLPLTLRSYCLCAPHPVIMPRFWGLKHGKLHAAIWAEACVCVTIFGYNQAAGGGVVAFPAFVKQFPIMDTIDTTGAKQRYNSTIQGRHDAIILVPSLIETLQELSSPCTHCSEPSVL